MEEQQTQQRTILPTEVDQEDAFISIAEFQVSLRQTLTVIIGIVVWLMAYRLTAIVLPISTLFAALLWGWIPVALFLIAFIKKNGEPYETYITEKIEFWLSQKHFINISDQPYVDIEDAEWDDMIDSY